MENYDVYREADQYFGGATMFVVVISFPPIKAGKDAEFREWFASTNEQFSNHKGFISRRLLKPLEAHGEPVLK